MYMLIFFSLLIATGFVIAFVWAINSGQFDDKFTPSVRILFDDTKSNSFENDKNNSKITSSTDCETGSEVKKDSEEKTKDDFQN